MSYAIVTSTEADGSGDVTTPAINTLSADLIVVWAVGQNGGAFTFTDDPSGQSPNTWTTLTERPSSGVKGQFYYVQAPNKSATHTFRLQGAFVSVYVMAFSGAVAAPFDQENGAANSSSATISTGSVTPSEANELIIAGVATNGSPSYAINGGFTIAQSNINAGSFAGAIACLIQTSATAANPQWSGLETGVDNAAGIATFKAAASGGKPVYAYAQQ
jgi:hypothetical protein